MARDKFDADFDFEKEYGFDPNEFLDSDSNADIDFSEFDLEDAGEGIPAETEDDLSDIDLDGLDLDDLNLDDLNLDGFDLTEDLDLTRESPADSGLDDQDFMEELPPEEDESGEEVPIHEEKPDVLVRPRGVSREDGGMVNP